MGRDLEPWREDLHPRDRRGRWMDLVDTDSPHAGKPPRIVRTKAGGRRYGTPPGTPYPIQHGRAPRWEDYGGGAWGYSHSISREITGEAARIMGIPGFQTWDDEGNQAHYSRERQRWARGILRAVHDARGSFETMQHGTINPRLAGARVGDVVDLPPTAASGSMFSAEMWSQDDRFRGNTGKPQPLRKGMILVFPPGTKFFGYSKNDAYGDPQYDLSDDPDFAHEPPERIWSEGIVAGRFRVVKRTDSEHPAGTDVLRLQQTHTFDVRSKRWEPVSPRMPDPTWHDTFATVVRRDHPDVSISLSRRADGVVTLHMIKVPPELRRQGIGRRIVEDLVREADTRGATLALSPTGEFGIPKARLAAWYRSHGFTPNTGRSRDLTISESMIRTPAT